MLLRYNVEKDIGVRQATDNHTTRHMPFACCISTGTDTHGNNVYANVTQYYVIRTLVVLCYGQYSIAFIKSISVKCQPPALAKPPNFKCTKINT